jgi:hypothetical protein
MEQTDSWTATCCAPPSDCSDTGGPTECSLRCAKTWVPFSNRCPDYLSSNFAVLTPFTKKCQEACIGNDCSSGPVQEPANITFVSFNVRLTPLPDGNSKDGLQSDIATALHVRQEDIIITDLPSAGQHWFSIDIFQTSLAPCESIREDVYSQWSQDSSVFATGRYSGLIDRTEAVQIIIKTIATTLLSAPNAIQCTSLLHHAVALSNPAWQPGGVSGCHSTCGVLVQPLICTVIP